MKKSFTILLALIYLFSFTGVTMHLHYCMGEQAGWDLGKKISNICSRCGMKKSEQPAKGCCTDESKFLKNTIDQNDKDDSVQLMSLQPAAASHSCFEISSILHQTVTLDYSTSHTPLRSQSPDIYIRNCIFRI